MKTLTLEEYQAEGAANGWRMLCPACGNVATPGDFEKVGANPQRAAQECIGRTMKPMPAFKAKGKTPCDWAAFGLLRIGGVTVKRPDGGESVAFDFAPAATTDRSAKDAS